ncbi:hypothetical protein ACFPYJ_18785 [Paenibacillus solisilvae]|uniref:Uncharacterized protein n=1 Tax=Paenibacillus solisilvae TaxID=2486751 RepID=A0ABW0VZ32_9BACL
MPTRKQHYLLTGCFIFFTQIVTVSAISGLFGDITAPCTAGDGTSVVTSAYPRQTDL